jgi:hypothetical protein
MYVKLHNFVSSNTITCDFNEGYTTIRFGILSTGKLGGMYKIKVISVIFFDRRCVAERDSVDADVT